MANFIIKKFKNVIIFCLFLLTISIFTTFKVSSATNNSVSIKCNKNEIKISDVLTCNIVANFDNVVGFEGTLNLSDNITLVPNTFTVNSKINKDLIDIDDSSIIIVSVDGMTGSNITLASFQIKVKDSKSKGVGNISLTNSNYVLKDQSETKTISEKTNNLNAAKINIVSKNSGSGGNTSKDNDSKDDNSNNHDKKDEDSNNNSNKKEESNDKDVENSETEKTNTKSILVILIIILLLIAFITYKYYAKKRNN